MKPISKSVRLTLRVSKSQFDFLTKRSRSLNKSVSDFLRFLINYHIAQEDKVIYENRKTDFND